MALVCRCSLETLKWSSWVLLPIQGPLPQCEANLDPPDLFLQVKPSESQLPHTILQQSPQGGSEGSSQLSKGPLTNHLTVPNEPLKILGLGV